MGTSTALPVTYTPNRLLIWLGALLTIVGFCGHFFAARAIGGTYVAFRDHIFGFFMILVVTGLIIVGLGRFFWRRRYDITVLVIGLVQALFGIVIYIFRYHV